MHLKTRKYETALALALALATAAPGLADNTTALTARSIAMNSTSQDFLESGSRASVWYKAQFFANRSYQVSVWTVREDGVFVNIDPLSLYSDAAGTVLVSSGVTTTDAVFEGSPNDSNLGPRTTVFQPTASGLYLINAGTDTLALASTKVNIRVRETTLFSPWTSKAAGFEGFIELHNNTAAGLNVTLKAFNNLGVLQGAGMTFSVPANATVFKTATEVGVPVNTFAGIVLTHDGSFGAISGNITTLNGANGLSFDSPFTPREAAVSGGSDVSASSGVNTDITSLTGLTTPLSVGQGGTGVSTLTSNGVLYGQGTAAVATTAGGAGQVLTGSAGAPVWTGSPSLIGSLGLPATTSSSVGVINQGGSRFIHAFGSFNFFAGAGAGNFTMTGTRNTAVGYGALQSQTTTDGNTAVGYYSLRFNTAGLDNTAAGREALYSNSTGSNNVGIGQRALYANTTGSNNAAIGFQALNFNTTGNENTAAGHLALQANTTASGNSAFGFQSLLLNTTASRNTAIGDEALLNQAFNNGGTAWDSLNTAVGYQALYANAPTTTSNGTKNTAIGANALRNNTTGRENTSSGSNALGNNTTGTANTATGTDALRLNTSGTNNVASGYESLYTNSVGSQNVASGVQSLLLNTTASKNVAIGGLALSTQAFNNGGAAWDSLNTAVGYQALLANAPTTTADGIKNTAMGANALRNNTTGWENTASGYRAMEGNGSGYRNTATGIQALLNNTSGYNNTAAGFNSLVNNADGYNNVAIGLQALNGNTSGIQNTSVGVNNLQGNSTGSNNTAIGYGANVSSSGLSNATAIGQGAVVNASNKIRLGDTAVTVIEGQVAYTFTSDRAQKENLREVDSREILRKLRGVKVTSWNYIGHNPEAFRHYGPMAQDFFAAFGKDAVGSIGTDTTINSGDITAVLMSGLQGLDAELMQAHQTLKAQATEIELLKQQVAGVTDLLRTLSRGPLTARTSGVAAGAPEPR